MNNQKLKSLLVVWSLMLTTLFTASCDSSFYLSEKEFYALRGQLATQDAANLLFGDLQGETLRVTFDNSVSPPRVQSSNLSTVMRNNLTTFALLEGFPFYYFQVDRVSGEVEKQFDNWLADRLRLYAGHNNAQVRLARVDEMRVQFMNNPTFIYSANRISFNVTLQMTVDCAIEVNSLDPVTNFLLGGVNGTHNVAVDAQNLQLQGDIEFDSLEKSASNLRFKLTPSVGNVVVRERGAAVPNVVKSGIATVIKQNLSVQLSETIKQKYDYFSLNNCRLDGQFSCSYESSPAFVSPELHAVARGTDNKLYGAVRRNDVWSNYTLICCTNSQIQINFASDPSLAVSSAGTVELAATTSTGELFYAQYQNGWKNYRYLLPVATAGTPPAQVNNFRYVGKPAIVATAPGQVEVVVARANGSLVHLRRLNGTWIAPAGLNLPSFTPLPNLSIITYRDPIAVQAGNRIFMIAAASNNRLYGLVFDLEAGTWFNYSQLQTAETIRYAPAAAASGDARVDVVYVGQSGNLYHRPFDLNVYNSLGVSTTGFSFGPETTISASVSAAPILLASGYRQLELVARGMDNRLYYNHLVGTHSPVGFIDGRNIVQGWTGWGELNGNFIGTQIISNGQFEEFAASATKTGWIDLVARARPGAGLPNSGHALHHNNYDAANYGRKPWKTVHWRGYQKIGTRLFSGRPALAALDGNFEVAYVGQNSNIYNAQHGANFVQQTNFQLLSNPAPVDPSVISSGKGLVDFIAVGADQKIKHSRQRNRGLPTVTTLPGQTALTFQTRPAVVGYGDGQLDVIGVSTSGSIHHWRHVNGVWQNPQQISGFVTSPPVLVNTGGGQLEFFAIGGDNKMYRWRFLSGAWGNWLAIPSAFTINRNRFAQGSATTWGDGTVDLAVVTNQAGVLVYHRHFEPRDDTVSLPNLPAQTFRSLGGWADSQPFIGAFNKNEKFVIVKDSFSSDFKYYSLNNSSNWQTGVLRGGNLGLQIGGIVNQPQGAMALATDVTGKVYFHNQFFAGNPRFDFAPVVEQTAQSQLRLPLYRPVIASHGGQ